MPPRSSLTPAFGGQALHRRVNQREGCLNAGLFCRGDPVWSPSQMNNPYIEGSPMGLPLP